MRRKRGPPGLRSAATGLQGGEPGRVQDVQDQNCRDYRYGLPAEGLFGPGVGDATIGRRLAIVTAL